MPKKLTVIFALAVIIFIIGYLLFSRPLEEGKETANGIRPEEKAEIEAWIRADGLNQYGDPKNTVYIGGTPLFDERTGESIDRYEYILENYPDKPWLQ